MKQNKTIYPPDPWHIREISYRPEYLERNETIFALANGYFGTRGTFEETAGNIQPATFINGFYETAPIQYGEKAFGYPEKRQVMICVPEAKNINLTVDGESFDLSTGKILSYERTLHMKEGALVRIVKWESGSGKQIELRIKRLVSLDHPHLAAIEYAVKPLNCSADIKLISGISGGIQRKTASNDSRVGINFDGNVLITKNRYVQDYRAVLLQKTISSGFSVICGVDHQLSGGNSIVCSNKIGKDEVSLSFKTRCEKDSYLTCTKYISYFTSLELPENLLPDNLGCELESGKHIGFKNLLTEQKAYLTSFWNRCDIQIDEGDEPLLQQGLRFSMFSLLQAAGRDGLRSVAAKGLTGSGYQGNYFWDTEIYMLPFYTYTCPEIARSLLDFRYRTLGKARERAIVMSQKGALFPWRTINGEENSPYFPAGTAQYHINANIIYGIRQYLKVNKDINWFKQYGAEIIFETARFWHDLGDYIASKEGKFCINEVTGPDEYTAMVNNNMFTNVMAADHLQFAAEIADYLRQEFTKDYQSISTRINLTDDEIKQWRKASEMMYVPYNQKLGIHPQDDCFLEKAVWDVAAIPKNKFPLIFNYHYLVIYRYQVLKQPDVVLAMFLQGHRFPIWDKWRNFRYYDPLTTGDSSLSPCVQCIEAAEIGMIEKSYYYFMRTARMDIDNINGNVKDGIHAAAMAGTWLAIIYGFAGMRDTGKLLTFKPVLPKAFKRLKFRLMYRHRLLEINIIPQSVKYLLIDGEKLTIRHEYEEITLLPDKPFEVSLHPALKAVIFDLDGVITDTAEYHYQAWKYLSNELGIPFDRKFNERLKGIDRMKSLELILERGNIKLSESKKTELAIQKNQHYQKLIAMVTPENILPGISNFLKELKNSGIKTAIASVSKNAMTVLKSLGIKDQFDFIVNAADIIKGKPDPEIFFRAAEGLKILPRDCAGIEDSSAGIESIKQAGMYSIGVGSGSGNPHWKIKDTTTLTLDALKTRFYKFFACPPQEVC